MEKYGERGYVPVGSMALAPMPVLQDGFYGEINDGPSQAPAWNISGNRLGTSTQEILTWHLPTLFEVNFSRVTNNCQ